MIDTQRLRDLADALQGCEWEVPLGSEQLCRAVAEELESLRDAVRTLSDYAAGTRTYWDDGQDHKVGKRIMAMAGMLRGYDSRIDAALAHAALEE